MKSVDIHPYIVPLDWLFSSFFPLYFFLVLVFNITIVIAITETAATPITAPPIIEAIIINYSRFCLYFLNIIILAIEVAPIILMVKMIGIKGSWEVS